MRHNFVFNFLYEIPGIKSESSALKYATGGWQLGGIFRVSSGLPFTPVIGGDILGLKNANPVAFPDRLNTPECKNAIKGNPNNYIKTECFVVPANPRQLGNAGCNILIGPGIQNFDLSLVKNNRFGERVGLQFRAELFNV